MRFSTIKIAVTLAAVLVVAGGCAKKDATGISVNVTGTWGGTGTQGGLSISFIMTVTEDGTGSITGNGTVTTFSSGGSGYSYTVSGTRDGSDVTLALNIPNLISPIYKAGLTATNTMTGGINGSGFANMGLRLDRM